MKKITKTQRTQLTMAVLILVAVFLISTALGHAQSLGDLGTLYTCPVTDDTYINTDRPTENNGTRNDVLVVERKSDGFAKFDLSALPANLETEEIQKATLKLWVKRVQAEGDIDLHLAEGTWDEGTLTAQSTPDIEWFYFATKEIRVADEGTFVEFDVTDVVKDWVDGTITNNGIALRPYSIEVALASKEDANSTGSTSKAMEIEVTLIGGGCPSGCKGEKGDTGPAPEHDWNGTALSFQYPDGSWGPYIDLKGDKGEPGGAGGEPGPPGRDGKDGKDGESGRDGMDGKDGKDGEPGPPGKDGRDGKDGKPGRDGIDGKDGRDGIDGKNGKNGMPGYEIVIRRITKTVPGANTGGGHTSLSAMCPSTKLAVGGGGYTSDNQMRMVYSRPAMKGHISNGWAVYWSNAYPHQRNNVTFQTYAICVNDPSIQYLKP